MSLEDLRFHIRSLSRFIYVVTEEENRVLAILKEMLEKTTKHIQVFNSAFGLVPLESLIEDWKSRAHKESSQTIHDALINIYREDTKNTYHFYVITDPERYLEDPQVVRRFLNLAHQLSANEKVIKVFIFMGPRLFIPQKMQRYVEVVYDTGPTDEEIKKYLDEVSSKLNTPTTDSLIRAFRGLTAFEREAAVSQNIIATKKNRDPSGRRVDIRYIQEYKRKQLRKTDLISYVDVSNDSFEENVGGLLRFKDWARRQKASWTDEGQKFGLVPPKGVLCVGIWGCGKSTSVKALGNSWRLPVVQLELGKLRKSGVGDSEANVYKAIHLIESVAPCILWIDEAEKSLSGAQSSAQSDAGTTGRMIGIFSTWVQETKSKVCLAMTANSLKTLPTEFVRRANERFFFDLPTEEERVDILKIHLKKRGQDPAQYNLGILAADSNFMVGSEIEHSILAAMTDSFDANKPGLDETILKAELKRRPRIYKALAGEVQELMDWVGFDPDTQDGVRARFASEGTGIRLLKK